MEIIIRAEYRIIDIIKKTTAKMFKNVEIGDKLIVEIVIRVGEDEKVITVVNTITGEITVGWRRTILRNLETLELERVDK